MEKSKTLQKNPSFFKELVDAFDLEWRLYYTLRDFYQKPDDVVQSYADGKGEYSNPIKLLMLCGTSYWIITSFLVDWSTIGEIVGQGYASFLKDLILLINSEASLQELETFTAQFRLFIAPSVVLIMEYLGVYAMIVALLNSTLLYRYTWKHGSSFRKIVGFMCYRTSTFIIILMLLLPFGLFSYWIPPILMLVAGLYIEYSRKSKKFSILSYLNIPEKTARKYQLKAMFVIFGLAGLFGGIIGFLLGFTVL